MKNYEKYKKLYDWKKPVNRTWPDKEITEAPTWCSVDLRDGNQALANPMTLEEKIEFFKYLVKIGFKEIEIGFPAASETEFKFTRYLIENDMIPDDVKVQVLTQARKPIIERTFESLKGAKNVIVHMYNSTSVAQRKFVFRKNKEEIKKIATDGAELLVEYAKKEPETNWYFEYTPESFTGTEVDYALEVVNDVLKIWYPFLKTKPIINFPATVECSTPNIFADQIQYISENILDRDKMIISIHSHNDRGTGVATSEMGILAGADRVEGSILGNGERTGNADILNIAMNMYVTGVDPKIDFSDLQEVKKIYEKCIKMPISPRHPYVGELVFTAFSGSHQDAISKGLQAARKNPEEQWDVPYLPLDPADVNRQYEPIIRINSQSGKGGVAFLLENEYGYEIPKEMRQELGYFIKDVSDKQKRELSSQEIYEAFAKEYINRKDKMSLVEFNMKTKNEDAINLEVVLEINGERITKSAEGNGPVAAFTKILKEMGYDFEFKFYTQDAQEDEEREGEKANVITYIEIEHDGKGIWAVGKNENMVRSSLKAMVTAINRILK